MNIKVIEGRTGSFAAIGPDFFLHEDDIYRFSRISSGLNVKAVNLFTGEENTFPIYTEVTEVTLERVDD